MKKRLFCLLGFFTLCLCGFGGFAFPNMTTAEETPPPAVQEVKEYNSKKDWKVIEAPLPEFVITKTDVLIDGNLESNYTTKITENALPQTFVVDMGQIVPVNFFELAVRNNESCHIYDYQLFTSTNGRSYSLTSSGTLAYNKNIASIEFNEVSARYFKFVAQSGGSDSYTAIAEFSNGIKGIIEQVILPNSEEVYISEGFESTETDTLISTKAESSMLMKFQGTQVNIFAKTGASYGKFDVFIDGRYDITINLAQNEEDVKFVYASAVLPYGEHAIEIKTIDEKEVEISYMTLLSGQSLVNASNIMKQVNDLTISLIVFCILFALVTTFIILYFAVPKFREFLHELFKGKDKSPKTEKTKLETKEVKKETPKPQEKANVKIESKKADTKITKAETKPAAKIVEKPAAKVDTKKTATKPEAKNTKPTKADNKTTKKK